MSGILRNAFLRASPVMRNMMQQSRSVNVTAPTRPNQPWENGVALLVFFFGFCTVPAYILMHVEDYKKKES